MSQQRAQGAPESTGPDRAASPAARHDAKPVPVLRPDPVPCAAGKGCAARRLAARPGGRPWGRKIDGATLHLGPGPGSAGPGRGRTGRRVAVTSRARSAHADLPDRPVECGFVLTLARDLRPRTAAGAAEAAPAAQARGSRLPSTASRRRRRPPSPCGGASGSHVFRPPIRGCAGIAAVAPGCEGNGTGRRHGSGADARGGPSRPTEEPRRRGEGLQAGGMIGAGRTAGPLPAQAGQRIAAAFAGPAGVRTASGDDTRAPTRSRPQPARAQPRTRRRGNR